MVLEKSCNNHFNKNEPSNICPTTFTNNGFSENQIKAGCLFAGIGSFARAFITSGAKVCWVNEKDNFAVETFRLNFPDVRCIHKPVEDVTVSEDKLEPVDILSAGFPCQPFSIAGKKQGLKDERGQLFNHIIKLIEEFGTEKPKILLLENVRNFRTHDDGRTFQTVQSEIQRAGYWFSNKNAEILNTMAHTDIPQNRERIFMVAFSADYFPCNTFKFPSRLPLGSRKKVQQFLDLNEKAPDEFYFKPGDLYYPYFEKAVKEGKPDSVYLLRRSYVRENKSGVCFTLMANMGEGGHNEPVIKDSWGIRKLTPRECARLQGFGDWFKIPENISKSQIGKQLGNTVTVPLAERLVKECITQIKNRKSQIQSEEKYEVVFPR